MSVSVYEISCNSIVMPENILLKALCMYCETYGNWKWSLLLLCLDGKVKRNCGLKITIQTFCSTENDEWSQTLNIPLSWSSAKDIQEVLHSTDHYSLMGILVGLSLFCVSVRCSFLFSFLQFIYFSVLFFICMNCLWTLSVLILTGNTCMIVISLLF